MCIQFFSKYFFIKFLGKMGRELQKMVSKLTSLNACALDIITAKLFILPMFAHIKYII